jgi:predicted ATPase/DNA-binding CsgD family transcriptional regulator
VDFRLTGPALAPIMDWRAVIVASSFGGPPDANSAEARENVAPILVGDRGRGLRPLPVPRTSFVGREREVAAVVDLLKQDDVRLVTLTGPGGAGKTRLAVRVAEVVAPRFADGVVFIALASLADAALVLPTVARTFGVREVGNRPLTRRLVDVLHGRNLLLVLDNFEHVIEAGTPVAELLSGCTGLSVLVTSRAPLRVSGEQDYPVPPLSVPDTAAPAERLAEAAAVRLFAERAHAVDATFALTTENAPTVAAICRRLDGLPLALELAAAKIRLLPLPALLARLEHQLAVLTGGVRDQPARLRTMRDAVAWSHDLLAADEQTLFRRLAIFVGGFDLEAAEAVAGRVEGTSVDVFSGVEALAEQSLVRRHEPVENTARFGMLETIREFGLERLEAAIEGEEICRAHAAHYLAFAERAEPELLGAHPDAWLARLTVDHGNLAAALRWFADTGDAAASARLAGALREYWYATGRWAEGRAWLKRGVSVAAELPHGVAAKALVTAGFLAHYQGDDVHALPLLERGLDLLQRIGDEREEAYAQYLLGVAAEDRGDYVAATQLLDEAVRRLRSMDDATNAAYGEAHLGIVALGEGDPASAVAHGEAARALATEAGSLGPTAVAVLLLGDAARDSGDLAAAAEHYGEYLELTGAATHGASEDVARAVAAVAVLAAERGERERAARLLGASERLRETVGLALVLPERAAYERASAQAREELGEDAFGKAVSDGRALAPREALAEVEDALALREPASEVRDSAPSGLSPREAEILRLIAAGRTNREIADALFLSVRTVERHITNLYAKIGARGRADATAFALRRGLA